MREARPIPLKDVDNVTTSYDNEARLHWLQWLLFCPPSSQQLSHSRILIEPDYLSIFSHCKYIQSKCSGSSTLKPLKTKKCSLQHQKCIGNRDTVKNCIFGVGNICSVCIKDFKDWFWKNSRIHRTAITKKVYELYCEIVQIGHQKDFDPIVNVEAPADVVSGNKIERKKTCYFHFSLFINF